MSFELHPNLCSKELIIDLPLSRVLFENNIHYPWIFLIPRKNNISKIVDLDLEDQITLTKELHLAQNVIWQEFKPDQLNVAAIGNKTPQLHVHIIARYKNDPAWPGTVWDHPSKEKYADDELAKIVLDLKASFLEELERH